MLLLGAFALFVYLQSPRPPAGSEPASGPSGTPLARRGETGSLDNNRATAPATTAGRETGSYDEIADPGVIAGSVLNLQGQRIAKIEIVATARSSSTPDNKPGEFRSVSDAAGRYRIDGLQQADYLVRSVETPQYPSRRITVRSGTSSADLVLAPRTELWVHGTVRDGETPLGGVRVVSARHSQNETYSDADGGFGLFMKVDSGAQGHDALQFSLQGYSNIRLPLRNTDSFATDLALADVEMSRVGGQATVRGRILADDDPVAGARVRLRARDSAERYQARSDGDGVFEMTDVAFGGYNLSVIAGSNFRDHSKSGLDVGVSGLDLRIALEQVDKAMFRGRMIDTEGEGLAGYSLWLTSLDARSTQSRQVTGDAQGYFELGDVAAGKIGLASHSEPRFRVSGIVLAESDEEPIDLTLDIGQHAIEGRVFDDDSNALPGARVSLIWSHSANDITVHAIRNAITDTAGYFRYSELGPGEHVVNVSASGFRRQRIEHEASTGAELQIKLRPSAKN